MSLPSLARSSTVMAIGTVASRGTGFVRTAVLAAALGSGALAESYNIPNTIPNAIYDLLLGGILSSVVVPLLVSAVQNDANAGAQYAQRLLTVVAVVLGAFTILGVLAAPWIVDLYARGLTGEQRSLSVTLTRYFLPQVFFYGLSATIGAILNTRGRFAAPMWAPVLNNLMLIGVGVVFIHLTTGIPNDTLTRLGVRLTHGEITLIGLGTTVGVVVQTLALLPSLRASGFRFRPRFDWRGTGLGAAGRLGGWVLMYVAVNQIGFAVITNLGRAAGAAGTAASAGHAAGHAASHDTFSAYMYAYQLFQLPYAIVAVSVITALLPRMSAHAANGRFDDVRTDLSTGLRTSGVAIVPAVALLIALAPQITTVVFHGLPHTRVSASDARYIGWILVAFATGLVPFAMFQLLLRAFYALHDTRTPALINVVATAVNIGVDIGLYLVLPAGWRVVGLAAGFALSYWVALALTGRALSRRLAGLDGRRVLQTYVRVAVAAAIAGGVAFGLAQLTGVLLGRDTSGSIVALVAGGGFGIAVLGSVMARMRIGEATRVFDLVRARISG
ncbi:MAG TPA: murein biosynthesis integral membrane protein MurJ [Acidothermaceae bacterium]